MRADLLAPGVGHALVSSHGRRPTRAAAGQASRAVARCTPVTRQRSSPRGVRPGQGEPPAGRSLRGDRVRVRGPPRRRARRRAPAGGRAPPAGVLRCATGCTGRWPGTTPASPTGSVTCATGSLLSEIVAVAVVGYVLITHSPGPAQPADPRGWPRWSSSACPAAAAAAAAGDDARLAAGPRCSTCGASPPPRWSSSARGSTAAPSSPLDALLFLTLTYMAVAYPPYGVVAMGAVMTGGYLLFVELPGLTTSGLFFLAVMVGLHADLRDGVGELLGRLRPPGELIRTQETLAATDPLTGIPNRRAFLERRRRRGRRRRLGTPDGGLPGRPRRLQGGQRRRRSRRRRRDAQGRSAPRWGRRSARPTPWPASAATSSPSWPTSR